MLPRVAERLDAVEDPRRRVGDRGEAQRLARRSGTASTSPIRRPPRVTRKRSAPVTGPASASSASMSACTAPRSISSRRFCGRVGHPAQVVVQRERPALVDRDHLEDAVAAQQPEVGDPDRRLVGGQDRPVDDGECGEGHDPILADGPFRWSAPRPAPTGSVRRASVPPPGAASSATAPPWASATWRTIARPRPEPGRPRALAPRWKRSKTCGRSAGSIPGPWSRTVSTPSRSDDLDGAAGGRVLGGVVEQVVDRAREALGRALDHAGLGGQAEVQARARGAARAGPTHRPTRRGGHLRPPGRARRRGRGR